MPYSRRSEGKLDEPSSVLINNYPSQTQSQNDLDAQINSQYTYKSIAIPTKRKIWQRSASCRELYDYSFEESGQAKKRSTIGNNAVDKSYMNLEKRKLESPVTRYDEHSLLYSSTHQSSLEMQQDIMVPDQKIYSSSYPGTTSFSQDSIEDPGNYDLRDSQDDLSHDSYELLEKSDDDISLGVEYKKSKTFSARSCSLDSGNYLPSDVDSDQDNKLKSKSSSDLLQSLVVVDDPRDYPREKIPRKSDGTYYKIIKLGSRASSLESKSDYYEIKVSKGSRKSSRETSFGSRTSSQESKSDSEIKKLVRKNKSMDSLSKKCEFIESCTSSLDSKSDYFDAISKVDESKLIKLQHEYDRKIPFERNYGIQKQISGKKDDNERYNGLSKDMSHVQTVSLQNVEIDNLRSKVVDNFNDDAAVPTSKGSENGRVKSLKETRSLKSTDSESNIFSFDEDRIQSLQENDMEMGVQTNHISAEQIIKPFESKKDIFKDVFVEIEPKRLEKNWDGLLLHQPIERTKSDPNSLARQRLNLSSRRHLLMHQKSIDLTPAESSDDDYLYRQIPSAPPITKYRGSHFEMPTAEFGHFDVLKREIEGQKTKFEVPKSQFEVLGAKTQSDLINLPPKNDIPYTLHKRHIMNGTASKEETNKFKETAKPSRRSQNASEPPVVVEETKPKSPVAVESEPSAFLFTQNIDLSKVDPVTLEVDKSKVVHHMLSPKRDITRIDPVLLETLNSKLSQIESDSPTSSKTESLKPDAKQKNQKLIDDIKIEQSVQTTPIIPKIETKLVPTKTKIKTDIKPKRVTKPRSQVNKKGTKSSNKTKIRITSFSSDDESLDSDDVFGSAEATPTKLEFSPPQTRKEMESILKYEAERKYLQYTMSSTEVEGSPPQSRKVDIPYDRTLDPNYQTELRRISERSISIPSSEDDLNIATADLQPVFNETLPDSVLPTVPEVDRETVDKSSENTICEDLNREEEDTITQVIEKAFMLQELPAESYQDSEEKALLKSDIERDLQDLRVPSKTKLTEIGSPSSRRKGQSSYLFAHARLNLSEGSAMTMLQKQQATESPVPGRRAKSLDTPVIPVNRLPPLNAFSSKDDTVEEEDHVEIKNVEESAKSKAPVEGGQPKVESKTKPAVKAKVKVAEKEKDQIVPDVAYRSKKSSKQAAPSRTQRIDSKNKVVSAKRPPLKAEPKERSHKPISKIPPKVPVRTASIKPPVPTKLKPEPAKVEEEEMSEVALQKQLTVETSEVKEIKRAKSQDIESSKKTIPKEKARSLDKLEFKRAGSRERIKSLEDSSDTDIAKRQEKQQMLYEIAIQQTKTVKSPIKDVLPVFPQVEESVRERHGKLEISINTIEQNNVSLEEAIIITKSPKRLDKKMDKKLTKSLELNLTDETEDGESAKMVQRLGKSLDLENRPRDEDQVYTFDKFEESPDDKAENVQKLVKAEVHSQPGEDERVTLEGTSLDIWLSLEDKNKSKVEALGNIVVIQKSKDFFEQRSKPPDLSRIENKSSSDSQSIEKVSLGNSLDIKYIDSSGDSSHKSEKDTKLISDLQKASETVGRLIAKKLEKRKQLELQSKSVPEPTDNALVRITSEDESLTEVSDLKCELDANLLGVTDAHKEVLLKLSIERSRSEDTGSWITVECDEYIGTEDSFEFEGPLESPEKVGEPNVEIVEEQVVTTQTAEVEAPENLNLLTTSSRINKIDLLKRSSDQSRSSDTTGSWTSGEKDLSGGNPKETGDESSLSCTMGQAIGLSQTIEKFSSRDQLDKNSPELEVPRSPRSPRICVLGRAFTIDEESIVNNCSDESSSEGANEIPPDITPIEEVEELKPDDGIKYKKSPYPFEEKWSSDSELGQRIHQKIVKKLSSADKSMSSIDDSYCDKRTKNGKGVDKRALLYVERLSAESRSSLDTESSSGSLGMAVRKQKTGELPLQEASSTWRPFPLESSGSSSFEEGILPPDPDLEREYFVSGFKVDADVIPSKENGSNGDISNFTTNFGYPCLLGNNSNICVNITSAEVLPGYSATFLGRTLSRISERSTNSEKSSLDEDSTKASTQLDSLNDESLASSDHQATISSDTPSNAHVSESDKIMPVNTISSSRPSDKPSEQFCHLNNLLLQRQISDDRRTSAEMAELSIDDIEIITSESGLKLRHQDSDDTVIDEEWVDPEHVKAKKGSSSQESDEWPLPEIPQTGSKPLFALHETGSSDASQITTQVYKPPPQPEIPKVFGLRGSLKSQDSEPWPSPPSSIQEPLVTGKVETHYITPPEEPCRVLVESSTVSAYDNDSDSDNENKTMDMDGDKSNTASDPTYENVATDQMDQISECISDSYSIGPSGVKIILQNKAGLSSSNSEEDLNISNLNDDVFVDVVEVSKNELRPPTVLRRSTNSDDSSHSGHKSDTRKHKSSHSSYSEEECTSSKGTNLEDGTVRLALKPTKCTHSSHSEDTSIALSLSEWSNSTNTVKIQNVSTSNSGATKSSSGLKSDDNSLADIAHSISEWSSSNSNTLKQHNSGLQFQKLSSSASTGDSSTLTEFVPTISDISSSDTSKTLIPQQFFNVRQSVTRLGSSIDDLDVPYDQKNIKSPQNIPSEDVVIQSNLTSSRFTDKQKTFTKSTERPVLIPIQLLSDTEKSTESSSLEQKTEKQRFMQKSSSLKVSDRPIKVPLSKCSPYYSSSLSSESTPVPSLKTISANKTATVPLTRSHKKPIAKSIFQTKSPPSENESTSSMESPKNTPDCRDRRGYRRRRQVPQKRHKTEKDKGFFYVEHESSLPEYNDCIHSHSIKDLPSKFQYENVINDDGMIMNSVYSEALEEGYFPDGDSQSGSDIFRMEREEELSDRYELAEGFDVSSIPPPLIEDDFEDDRPPEI
ncbi:uncharacterized protein LOC116172381 isoform X1 [Photinus pyralis]|nr:uncharacterized protein LOC116172381 isoform X1 [Photinus pyralis]